MIIPMEIKTVSDDRFDIGRFPEKNLAQVSRYANLGFALGWSPRPICIMILIARESGRVTSLVFDGRHHRHGESVIECVRSGDVLDSHLQHRTHPIEPWALAYSWFEEVGLPNDFDSTSKWMNRAVRSKIRNEKRHRKKNK